MVCALCEEPSEFWFGSLCKKCRKIKHYQEQKINKLLKKLKK